MKVCGLDYDGHHPPFYCKDGFCNLCSIDPKFKDDPEICFKHAITRGGRGMTAREEAYGRFWTTMKPLVGDTPAGKIWCEYVIDSIIDAAREGMVDEKQVKELIESHDESLLAHLPAFTEREKLDKEFVEQRLSAHRNEEHLPGGDMRRNAEPGPHVVPGNDGALYELHTTGDLNDVLNNLPKYVWLNDGGRIMIEKRWLSRHFGFETVDLLKSCVEDNILYSGGRTRRGEFIDYDGAVRDFHKAKGEKDADKN